VIVSTHNPAIEIQSGFIAGMPEAEYHAHPAISKSGLDRVDVSPAHFNQAQHREPTPAMLIGTAIHLAILEPDRFATEYHVAQAKTRREAGYKDLVSQYGVERVLMPDDHAHVVAIQNAALARPAIKRLAHAEGWPELSAFTTDPETGVAVRCRYDRLAKAGFAVDLKKASDPMPRGFSRSVASFRYHVQVAFYSDIYFWLTGERLTDFWLIAIEDSPPYTVLPWRLDDLSIEAGRIAYRRNLNTYSECLAANEWPMFEPETDLLSLPDWALGELENEMEIF
jgi:hypothetical protein